ncbi:MAG: gamma-glutamyl-gamma-aminobutyrate hydrolase family protein, partial [Trueperella pyogenes]|nr:gamma-glutamyl-gamma-aminobutyrate hydrolase family protein [Trueperella pyogenes]
MKAIGQLSDNDLHPLPLVDAASPHPASDIDLDQYSGVIITGSPFGFEHPHEQKTPEHLRVEERIDALTSILLERDFPTFGICFGLQSLARTSGAPIVEGFSEDLQAPEISLTEAGLADPLTGQLPPKFHAYTGHADAIGS